MTLQEKISKVLADLQVKAMMFDLDIDWETLSLVPKEKYHEPYWLTNWKEKQHESDFDTRFDIDQE